MEKIAGKDINCCKKAKCVNAKFDVGTMEAYIYNGNDKLVFYPSRHYSYYALDSDVAVFLGMPMSSMLMEMHIKESSYREDLRIEFTDEELKCLEKCKGIEIKRVDGAKIYGFNLEGVIMLAYSAGRGGRCKEAAQELFNEYFRMLRILLNSSASRKRLQAMLERKRKALVNLELAAANAALTDKEKYDKACKTVAGSIDKNRKELEDESFLMDWVLSGVPGGLRPLLAYLDIIDQDIKHIAYGGKKLDMHQLLYGYYAADNGLAKFFGVDVRVMRRRMIKEFSKFYVPNVLVSDDVDKLVPGRRPQKTYRCAYSLEGIITMALILNSPESDKFVYELVRETSKLTAYINTGMFGLLRTSRFTLSWLNQRAVDRELNKEKWTEEQMLEFESKIDGNSAALTEELCVAGLKILGLYAGPAKKLMENMPKAIKMLLFSLIDLLWTP
jgi:hypothetical protein